MYQTALQRLPLSVKEHICRQLINEGDGIPLATQMVLGGGSGSTLAALARTCRLFHEPALNVLWHSIPDIFVLFYSLPSTCYQKQVYDHSPWVYTRYVSLLSIVLIALSQLITPSIPRSSKNPCNIQILPASLPMPSGSESSRAICGMSPENWSGIMPGRLPMISWRTSWGPGPSSPICGPSSALPLVSTTRTRCSDPYTSYSVHGYMSCNLQAVHGNIFHLALKHDSWTMPTRRMILRACFLRLNTSHQG